MKLVKLSQRTRAKKIERDLAERLFKFDCLIVRN